MNGCERPGCTGQTAGDLRYCSDACMHADQDFDGPPVTVLARNKAGGVGRGLEWGIRQHVAIPGEATDPGRVPVEVTQDVSDFVPPGCWYNAAAAEEAMWAESMTATASDAVAEATEKICAAITRETADRAVKRDHSLCGVEPCSDCR